MRALQKKEYTNQLGRSELRNDRDFHWEFSQHVTMKLQFTAFWYLS